MLVSLSDGVCNVMRSSKILHSFQLAFLAPGKLSKFITVPGMISVFIIFLFTIFSRLTLLVPAVFFGLICQKNWEAINEQSGKC